MPRITIRPFCVCQREGGREGGGGSVSALSEGGRRGERRRECECIVRGTHMDQCEMTKEPFSKLFLWLQEASLLCLSLAIYHTIDNSCEAKSHRG